MGAADQRGFLIRLMIVVLAGLGAFFFRRSLVAAYPDASIEGLGGFGDRARAKAGEIWSKRPKSLPGRMGEAKEGPGTDVPDAGSPAASATTATPAAAAPSAETEVLPAQGEPESSRLDQLERLADMHGRGVLTDSEFASEKRRIMGDGG